MLVIGNDWDNLLKDEFNKDYFIKLQENLLNEYKTQTIYPAYNDIFNALKLTAFSDVKVVILGQDPYHGEGQAHGLAFSVKKDVKKPSSLVNIIKEIHTDIDCDSDIFTKVNIIKEIHSDTDSDVLDGFLTHWAKQGVLLLNTILTVRKGQPNSHKKIGWEIFTDKIITLLSERRKPVVFLLWGNNAKAKMKLIKNHHKVLTAAHPSSLSAYRGFFGCKHFSKTNEFLKETEQEIIKWGVQ